MSGDEAQLLKVAELLCLVKWKTLWVQMCNWVDRLLDEKMPTRGEVICSSLGSGLVRT